LIDSTQTEAMFNVHSFNCYQMLILVAFWQIDYCVYGFKARSWGITYSYTQCFNFICHLIDEDVKPKQDVTGNAITSLMFILW